VAGLFPAVSISEENFAVSEAYCLLYFTPFAAEVLSFTQEGATPSGRASLLDCV
jgi:hypothetical protein